MSIKVFIFILIGTFAICTQSCLQMNSVPVKKEEKMNALDSFVNSLSIIKSQTIYNQDTVLQFNTIRDTAFRFIDSAFIKWPLDTSLGVNMAFLNLYKNVLIDPAEINVFLTPRTFYQNKIYPDFKIRNSDKKKIPFSEILNLFKNKTQFYKCKFDALASNHDHGNDHIGYVFDSTVEFYKNCFYNQVKFYSFEFKDSVFLWHIASTTDKIVETPIFENCIFKKGIIFKLSKFTEFTNSIFIKDLEIRYCTIDGTINLSNCIFDSSSKLILAKSNLPDTLNFSNTKLSGTIDLTEAFPNPDQKCEINLLNTDIDKIKMQYRNFHLYIPDSILNNEQARDQVTSTYEGLLANFKKNGFGNSYEQLDIEYKRWQSKTDYTLRLSDWWWKFGYQKWRIILYTLAIIVLFSFFNYACFGRLQTVYPVEKLHWKNIEYTSSGKLPFFKKYFFVLLYTGLIFFRFTIDFKNVNFSPLRYVAVIIFQYSVGLVCTGFLINWILK